jgi:hypothetical protein
VVVGVEANLMIDRVKQSLGTSPIGRDLHPLRRRRSEQCVVPCDDDEVWIAQSIRSRWVYSLIAPTTVRLCEVP